MNHLSLEGKWLKGGSFFKTLSDEKYFGLLELNLRDNSIGSEGARILAQIPFRCLYRLDLYANQIEDSGIEYLTEGTFCQTLKELGLGGQANYGLNNSVTDVGVRMISTKFGNLTKLDLSSSREVTGAGLAKLAMCSNLSDLCINSLFLEDSDVIGLVELGGRLKNLEMKFNGLSGSGLDILRTNSFLDNIESLDLGGNPLGFDGTIALTKTRSRPLVLDLSFCKLEDTAIVELSNSPLLSRVRTLNLSNNGIGDVGLAALIGSSMLNSLKTLIFHNNPAGPKAQFASDWDGSESFLSLDTPDADRIASLFNRKILVR